MITDGVFSMDGDVANLPGIVDLAERYDAIVYVDDAHASGVFGKNGRGTVDHFDLHGRVHVQVGTLSKAIGVLGGYVAGPKSLRDLLIHRGRPFYSAPHTRRRWRQPVSPPSTCSSMSRSASIASGRTLATLRKGCATSASTPEPARAPLHPSSPAKAAKP